ncbi:alanine racemase [uncultured Megamonas sp.]|nr:alanine racemase [uncultured Megamonas sp.]
MMRLLWTEIDLDVIAKNMQIIRKMAKSKEVAAVIKADAYGHGSVTLAKTLLDNGADRLAVARLDEALELRHQGIVAPIFILGYTNPIRANEAIAYNIDVCIFDYEQAKLFSEEAVKQQSEAVFHIAIDSGMQRIGYQPTKESVEEIIKISKLPNVKIEGIFTHFCLADCYDKTFTHTQYKRFKWVCDELAKAGVKINVHHCANSATIIDLPEYHYDMVRAGVILYGMAPSDEVDISNTGLKPAMSFKCEVTHVKTIKPGDGVSYGHKFIAKEERVIATIPVGYADGYTRLLSGKAEVLIHGKRAKVVGNICMDQCMVDVTDIKDVKVGDEVVLFGKQGEECILADELAEKLGTINYEITCMISRRVPRFYIQDKKLKFYKSYLSDLAISMYNV